MPKISRLGGVTDGSASVPVEDQVASQNPEVDPKDIETVDVEAQDVRVQGDKEIVFDDGTRNADETKVDENQKSDEAPKKTTEKTTEPAKKTADKK